MLSAGPDKRSNRSRKSRSSSGISLVARDSEFAVVLNHIARRKSIHIYGDEGVGKSALLDGVYDLLKAQGTPPPIYCRSSRTLRNILLQMALFLLSHFSHLKSVDKFKRVKEIRYCSDIKKLNIRTLRNVVYSFISMEDFCVILDHLEYVTPKINGFLTTLYEKAAVITASRQSWELSDYGFKGRLDYCLYHIPKLRVGYLSRQDAFSLMRSLAGNTLDFHRSLFEDVYRVTKGNAGMTKAIVTRALLPEYHNSGHVNLNLIMIDLMMGKVR